MTPVPLAELDPVDLPPGRSSFRATVGEAGCDVLTIRGDAGPVLLVIGAVHGDEYEGPTAAATWWGELEPEGVTGAAIVIPVVNEDAFYARSRCAPGDGMNLAREFPGNADGTPTQQLAAALHALIGRCAGLIDLHAAGTCYTLHPWAGYARLDDAELEARQKAMAIAFGLDFVWSAPAKPGRILESATLHQVPAIYVEMTGAGLCRAEDVDRTVQGLRGVAACLGLTSSPYPTSEPRFLRESLDPVEDHLQLHHPAPCRGVFHPTVDVWQEVRRGEVLGYVSEPTGFGPRPIEAQRTGRIAMLRTAPPVDEGEYLAVVVPL